MELLFVAIQILNPMENGMIGLWSNSTMVNLVETIGMWSDNYFPSKVMCFFVILNDDTTYAIIHFSNVNDHENDSILFERWELENTSSTQRNGKSSITANLHVVDVDTFGDPILVIKDYTIEELQSNDELQMVIVITPFAKAWPNKFMSGYQQ